MTIEIKQKAIITRTAFDATLKISNGTSAPLTKLHVQLKVQDELGNDATAKFGIPLPTLTFPSGGVAAVDGTGEIPANASASAEWLILAKEEAVPGPDPIKYTVSGEVQHTQDGVLVTMPLYPVEIDVYPDPRLYFDYYLQSPVYSDNPFTADKVEPAEPFSLALRVRNEGYGSAKDLTIVSAQPEVVKNEDDLLIQFKIIGTQVGANPAPFPCLTAPLGTLAPGGRNTARWLLTSSLQGKFICYDATFTHETGLGDPALSLIEDVAIYELTHVVQIAEAGFDALPDFLVGDYGCDYSTANGSGCKNDVGTQCVNDPTELPSVVHSSEGPTHNLVNVETAAFDGLPDLEDLEVEMYVSPKAAGWMHLRVPDPGQGGYVLKQVLRATETTSPAVAEDAAAEGSNAVHGNARVGWIVSGHGRTGAGAASFRARVGAFVGDADLFDPIRMSSAAEGLSGDSKQRNTDVDIEGADAHGVDGNPSDVSGSTDRSAPVRSGALPSSAGTGAAAGPSSTAGNPAVGPVLARLPSAASNRTSFTQLLVGGPGDICNAWTTHRWLPINGPPTAQEHRLYVFDYVPAAATYNYVLVYEPGLVLQKLEINSGLGQRSTLRQIAFVFNAPTNAAGLIANGKITRLVKLFHPGPTPGGSLPGPDPGSSTGGFTSKPVGQLGSGGGLPQVELGVERFTWDSIGNRLVLDLTSDGPGPALDAWLGDGNYEIALVTTSFTNALGDVNLIDSQGPNDSEIRFGTLVDESLYQLAGDAVRRDRRVDAADYTFVRSKVGLTPGDPLFDASADLDGDGDIDMDDLEVVEANRGSLLGF